MLDWDHPETWTVLVVDDEADNAEVVMDALKFMGADVRAAHDGVIGMEVLKDFSASLILLDLSMPHMDGWEMHRQVRADSRLTSVLVVALSAHAMMGDKERVLAAGFDGYMSKPVSLFTFIKDLRAAVESTHALWASPQAAEPLSAPVPTPLPTVTAVPAAAPTPSETVSPVPAPAPVESHEVKS